MQFLKTQNGLLGGVAMKLFHEVVFNSFFLYSLDVVYLPKEDLTFVYVQLINNQALDFDQLLNTGEDKVSSKCVEREKNKDNIHILNY
jgi:hypothetical protein